MSAIEAGSLRARPFETAFEQGLRSLEMSTAERYRVPSSSAQSSRHTMRVELVFPKYLVPKLRCIRPAGEALHRSSRQKPDRRRRFPRSAKSCWISIRFEVKMPVADDPYSRMPAVKRAVIRLWRRLSKPARLSSARPSFLRNVVTSLMLLLPSFDLPTECASFPLTLNLQISNLQISWGIRPYAGQFDRDLAAFAATNEGEGNAAHTTRSDET